MLRCLKCGAIGRGKKLRYVCKCCGIKIPVSSTMRGVASKLYLLGFDLQRADDYLFLPDINGNSQQLLIFVDFNRQYDSRVLSGLPEGFAHQPSCDGAAGEQISRVIFNENFFTFGKYTAEEAKKIFIQKLYNWVVELEYSGNADILRLAALI